MDTQDTTVTTPSLEDTIKSKVKHTVEEERPEYQGNLIVEYDDIIGIRM